MNYQELKDFLIEDIKKEAEQERAIAKYRFEIDEDIDLSNLDESKLERLLLGNVHDIEDDWLSGYDDYISSEDDNLFEEIRDRVLEERSEQIAETAELLGLDEDELTDDIKDDPEISLHEIGIDGFHYRNYNYQGTVSGTAKLTEFSTCMEDEAFLNGLRDLRIPLGDFIEVAIEKLNNEMDEDNDLSDDMLKNWGLDIPEGNENEYVPPDYILEYKTKVMEYHQAYLERTGVSLMKFDLPPVIDAKSLIDMTDNEGHSIDVYAQFGMGSSMIDDVSRKISTHGWTDSNNSIPVLIKSGVVYASRYPCDEGNIKSPIAIDIQTISVGNDKPESGCEDDIELPPELNAYSTIYKSLLCGRGEGKNFSEPFDLSNDGDKKAIAITKKSIEKMDNWAVDMAMSQLTSMYSQIKDVDIGLIRNKDDKSANLKLIDDVENYEIMSIHEKRLAIKRINHIIDNYDISITQNNGGTGLLNLATQNGLPNSIIKKMLEKDMAHEHNPEIDNPLTRAGNNLAKRLNEPGQSSNVIEKQNNAISNFKLFMDNSNYELPISFAKKPLNNLINTLIIKDGHADLLGETLKVVRNCNPGPELDKYMQSSAYFAAREAKHHSLSTILAVGANIKTNEIIENIQGIVDQKKSQFDPKHWGSDFSKKSIEGMENSIQIIRSHKAKNVAMDILAELDLGFDLK